MRYLLSLVIIFVLSLIEITWPQALRLSGVRPELLLIAVIFFALERGAFFSIFPASLSGLIKDIFSPTPLGTNLFLFLLLGLLIGRAGGRFNKESPFLPLTLSALGALLVNLVTYLCLRYSLLYPIGFFDSFFRIILPVTFYTALASFFIFAILRRLPLDSKRRGTR